MLLLLRMRRRSLPLRNRWKRNRRQPAQLLRTKPAIRYCRQPAFLFHAEEGIRYCLLLNRARLGLPIHSIPKTKTMLAHPAPIVTTLIRPNPHLKQMVRLPERISENGEHLTLGASRP